MSKISMVMFDLSGTTVHDDTGVRDCLYEAAQEHNLDTTPDEILLHMGTNKIHLYQFSLRGREETESTLKILRKQELLILTKRRRRSLTVTRSS